MDKRKRKNKWMKRKMEIKYLQRDKERRKMSG